MKREEIWHALESDGVLQTLGSTPSGLSHEEARQRLSQFGPNVLEEAKKASPLFLFLGQFKSFLLVILLIAAALSALMGEAVDAALIFAVVLLAAGLGFIQEYRAERAMEALRSLIAPTATVLRQGEEKEIPAKELVSGDMVLLQAGDRIPADLRLMEGINLRANEAALTGESVPVDKTTAPIPRLELPVGDRSNMAFMGTAAVYGRGKGVVVATGMATQFGQVAGMLQQVEESRTPLQANLDRVGKVIGSVALTLAGIFFFLGLLRGEGLFPMFLWAVSLAVAVVPEALPAVVTISLALGVQRMARRHALIRRLLAVETLGSTSVICSDKTGTLTQDQMTVRRLYVNGQMVEVGGVGYDPQGDFSYPREDEHLQRLLQVAALCNDARLFFSDGSWQVRGDPTEGALLAVAAKGGWDETRRATFPRLDELPFSSEERRMVTLHPSPQGKLALAKGAPEVILHSCSHIYHGGQEKPLTPEQRQVILDINAQLASEALRVLALAFKPLPQNFASLKGLTGDMVFVGLVGMMDPPREEVKAAMEECRRAGIKPVMITGDHKLTATAIARELGMLEGGQALTGEEMDSLSQEELEKIVDQVQVYARVSPAHKLRIVEAWSRRGRVVAMTGDGVNDAPALKRADIGIAMGITGTDVSKEASDMVLTDDNFASIVAAVEEGRGVFQNIKKVLAYLLSANLGEVLLMVGAALAGLPLPLTAIQLLYVNLATDGLPAIALGVDPPPGDIMKRSPRPPRQGIFTPSFLRFLAGMGIWTGVMAFGVFLWALNSGKTLVEAQALTFVTLIFLEFFNALNCRSLEHSLFKVGPWANRWLLGAIALNIVITLAIIYIPFLQVPFHTFSLGLRDWAIALLASSTIFLVAEIGKGISLYLRQRK